jgi:hypothetical protein
VCVCVCVRVCRNFVLAPNTPKISLALRARRRPNQKFFVGEGARGNTLAEECSTKVCTHAACAGECCECCCEKLRLTDVMLLCCLLCSLVMFSESASWVCGMVLLLGRVLRSWPSPESQRACLEAIARPDNRVP